MGLQRFLYRVWPKHSVADRIAFMVTHVGLVGMFFFEMLVVLPLYHEPFSTWYLTHVFCGLFFAFNVFANMYKMILIDSTVKSEALRLPSVLRPGWYYCPNCQINAPPRAHHCPICEVCVIKRDHHCIFTGNCVGYYNHRYFFCMALYLWVGCVYAMLFNLEYYGIILGGFQLSTAAKMIFPMVAWTFGYVTLHQLGISIVAGITFMAMFLFSCLVAFQIYFITRGQTQFECKKKINDYRTNPIDDIKLVLGKQWYMALLFPYCKSELPGDGTEFFKLPEPLDTKTM